MSAPSSLCQDNQEPQREGHYLGKEMWNSITNLTIFLHDLLPGEEPAVTDKQHALGPQSLPSETLSTPSSQFSEGRALWQASYSLPVLHLCSGLASTVPPNHSTVSLMSWTYSVCGSSRSLAPPPQVHPLWFLLSPLNHVFSMPMLSIQHDGHQPRATMECLKCSWSSLKSIIHTVALVWKVGDMVWKEQRRFLYRLQIEIIILQVCLSNKI